LIERIDNKNIVDSSDSKFLGKKKSDFQYIEEKVLTMITLSNVDVIKHVTMGVMIWEKKKNLEFPFSKHFLSHLIFFHVSPSFLLQMRF
jgi:hypothetical protein